MPERSIKKVAIVIKPDNSEARQTGRELTDRLGERGIATIAEGLIEAGNGSFQDREFPACDLVVVLGGDGTMISTARMIGDADVLVLGVNYGSLGYLTDFRIEEMYSALDAIFNGEYAVDRRVMLHAEHWRNEEMIAGGRVLNDVVVTKAAVARIIEIETRLDGQFVNSFRADGLIAATPTGSTAYNLSAGGPIIFPSMNAIVLTPICPFALTNRPIVVPDTSQIELELQNENEGVVLTLDGQIGYPMLSNDIIKIRKSRTTLNLLQPPNRNYFDVLRNKLKWGR
jgi:NAD+ kinase